MKIIIAGAGEVGTHLARLLSRENHDITIIDTDEHKLEMLDTTCNLLTILGSPISFSVQAEAKVGRCDLFIAVTPEETTNLLACSIAKSSGARRTVARVDNYEFITPRHNEYFAGSGIDAMPSIR